MKIYGITDTHFGHEKLKTMGAGRPNDYEARMLKSICLGSGDILIHTGDFAIGNDEQHVKAYMEAAKGFKSKVLVRGNHDGKTDSWYYAHGFTHICDTMTLTVFGKRLLFSHVPHMREQAATGYYKPDVNFHGHLHGDKSRHGRFADYDSWLYDLAPDLHNFQIVSIEKALGTIKSLRPTP